MDEDRTVWPKHEDGRNKKISEMTREERDAVTASAARRLQAEADDPASTFSRALRAILTGPVVPRRVQ